MATKALTAIAHRASRKTFSSGEPPRGDGDWRKILARQDPDIIWRKLSALSRVTSSHKELDPDAITQELFLFLITTERFTMYLEKGYSNEEINSDLVSLLAG